jgi:capsid protein
VFDFLKKRKIEKAKNKYIKGEIALYDFFDAISGGYSGNKIDFSFGGFGKTKAICPLNLVNLQVRSHQLYNENPYAAAIINRIVTKTVNNGFRLRTTPVKKVLDFLPETYFKEFSEKTESLFSLWSKEKELVCFHKTRSLQESQSLAMRESLVYGDSLVIQYIDKLGLPEIELIPGCDVRTPPLSGIGKNIFDGVEYSEKGEPIAYFVYYYDRKTLMWDYKRVEAKDKKGNLRAWLVKSGLSASKSVRGVPILAVILQNLNDVGRYMDSEQRAALVNSIMAVVHSKGENQVDNLNRFRAAGTVHNKEEEDDTGTKDFEFRKMKPGFFATNLEAGETIKSFDTSRPNVNFGSFTDVVTKPMFYVNGLPPEVAKMEYGSNYSASRAAIIEFEHRCREINACHNGSFSSIIYKNWLDGMILTGEISAPKYIEAIRDKKSWYILAAYRSHVWRGLPKINIDGYRQAKENEIAVAMGLQTRAQIADEQYSSDFFSNADDLEKEAEKIKIIKEKSGVEEDGTAGN